MTPNRNLRNCRGDEGGFVLIGALLILMLLVIIGISATTNTSLELQIAGNDRTHKETFYQADGGAQFAARLVEETIGSDGFTAGVLIDPNKPNNSILIINADFRNVTKGLPPDPPSNMITASRDWVYFPNGYNPAAPNAIPHTNITIADGDTGLVAGAGLQMLAGYEGKGKGTAGGGARIDYKIYSQHIGQSNSESIIEVQWRHLIGLELEERY